MIHCYSLWMRWFVRLAIVFLLVVLLALMRSDEAGHTNLETRNDTAAEVLTDAESAAAVQRASPDVTEAFEIPTRKYIVPGCPCARQGLDVRILQARQREARERPGAFPKWFLSRFSFEGESTCSDFATQRGGNQRVVSYSYYTTTGQSKPGSEDFHKYLGQLYGTAEKVHTSYPDWVMRIYHNVSIEDAFGMQTLCHLHCNHGHVDLCHVHDLPGLGNLHARGVAGRLWRFAVMGDPTAELFLCRDSDSWILNREVAAVAAWLQSGRTYHLIHDHPSHTHIIMAGLWGALNRYPKVMRNVRDEMFNRTYNFQKLFDQQLLAELVWPIIKHDVINHDSYTCNIHDSAVPFPTRRGSTRYCGWSPWRTHAKGLIKKTMCPIQCRPPGKLKWKHC
ncbi:uncharacterized protein LOC125041966 isoform X1 [Penaeus chinensis]|uniref:uncharacterized protein LOC125041966 isoform X1 n=1 Tax=Penaeus chinensis TaxID=139456 RepID=UPI001FB7D4F3|nr:uncharacterized protein LOC125041966 isoform X1 [Penaeus chinensis]